MKIDSNVGRKEHLKLKNNSQAYFTQGIIGNKAKKNITAKTHPGET